RTGNDERGAQLAEQMEDQYVKEMAVGLRQILKDGKARARVRLDVDFVRQHYRTCAPATVAAIGRVWKMPADHLTVAEGICYDGSPTHRQRTWASENGWTVREFTVTAEGARALLDRGMPFIIITVDPGNAHAQAVVGDDELRRPFFIRDPYQPFVSEVLIEPFLKRYVSSGPRGMVLVPEA